MTKKKDSEKDFEAESQLSDPDVPSKHSKLICTAFPVAAWIILIHELLERFSFYGMKGILTLYLKYLGFSDDLATAIYHLFTGISYLTPIIGGFVSDNFWGKFKTIIILGIVYLIGHILMPTTAAFYNVPGPMIAIFIVALGTGGIKPCVAAFGGDQIPKGDDILLDVFFSFFYMCINIGAFISQVLTPMLRETECLGLEKCYPLAFGVPAIAFFLCLVLFIAGMKTYKIEAKPEEPVLNKCFKCIGNAIKNRWKLGKLPGKAEVLDYADEKYDSEFVKDVKTTVSVLFLFLPFPIYWALFDQQGSRWTLQAETMDGYITEDFTIQPDQMQTVNPLLIVLIIPLFNNIIYPLLAKCNAFKSATSRIFAGYLICSAAFMLTGVVDIIIDNALPKETVDGQNAVLRLYNQNPCTVNVTPRNPSLLDFDNTELKTKETREINVRFSEFLDRTEGTHLMVSGSCLPSSQAIFISISVGTYSTLFLKDSPGSTINILDRRDVHGTIRFRVVLPKQDIPNNMTFLRVKDGNRIQEIREFKSASNHYYYSGPVDLQTRISYDVYLVSPSNSEKLVFQVNQATGERLTYRTLVKALDGSVHTITELSFDLIHRAWQLPQYFLMCISEVLFSVTAMAYAYSEAPPTLKSLLQTFYLITIFFGNMIVLIVALLPSLPKRYHEFFMFGALVFVGGFIQLIIIYYYNKRKNKKNKVEPILLEETKFSDTPSSSDNDMANGDAKKMNMLKSDPELKNSDISGKNLEEVGETNEESNSPANNISDTLNEPGISQIGDPPTVDVINDSTHGNPNV